MRTNVLLHKKLQNVNYCKLKFEFIELKLWIKRQHKFEQTKTNILFMGNGFGRAIILINNFVLFPERNCSLRIPKQNVDSKTLNRREKTSQPVVTILTTFWLQNFKRIRSLWNVSQKLYCVNIKNETIIL